MNNGDKAKDGSLIRVAKQSGLVARSASLTKRGLESLQTLDRVVIFPLGVSIGDVYLFTRTADVGSWFKYMAPHSQAMPFVEFKVEEIKNVCGNLKVTDGKQLVLVVSDERDPLLLLSTLAPDSLQGLLMAGTFFDEGFEYIGHLTGLRYLSFPRECLTDACLAYISNLTALSYLDLGTSKITDDGLSHLSTLTSLTVLDLNSTKITGEGLSHLSNLTSLSFLDLSHTKVTDEGLSFLSNLTSLLYLDLGNIKKVTNEGLSYISNLTSLSHLDLSGSQITDEGLFYLSDLTSLSHLDLSGTKLTGEGLSYLSNLTSLSYLSLTDTNVTKYGLPFLYDLRSLKDLYLRGVPLATNDVRDLRVFLPDCSIDYQDIFINCGPNRYGRAHLLRNLYA